MVVWRRKNRRWQLGVTDLMGGGGHHGHLTLHLWDAQLAEGLAVMVGYCRFWESTVVGLTARVVGYFYGRAPRRDGREPTSR